MKKSTAQRIRDEASRRGAPTPLDHALSVLAEDQSFVRRVEAETVVACACIIRRQMKAKGIGLTLTESNDLAIGVAAVLGNRLSVRFKPPKEVAAHFKAKLDWNRLSA